jgi:hypothetical protein
MAAVKPDVLTTRLVDMIETKFQRLPHISGSRISTEPFRTLSDARQTLKSKMAAVKPDVLTTGLLTTR